jgi:hypothetical protein
MLRQVKYAITLHTETLSSKQQLILKGLEPILDNSIGYILPFYTILKIVFLLVFARFRHQVSAKQSLLARDMLNLES